MRFISTRVHGVLDYLTGMLLLAAPWIFQFDHGGSETAVPIALGAGVLVYSLFTDYELAVARHIPMKVHLALDAAAGLLLAASPWLFGFADAVLLPHVLIGGAEVLVALLTRTKSARHAA